MARSDRNPQKSASGPIGRLIGLAIRRYFSNRQGVTAIEFSLVAFPFFLIVIGIFEIGIAYLVNRLVDNAVLESARAIRTGQALKSGFDAEEFKEYMCGKLPGILCDTNKFVVEVTTFDDFSSISLDDMVDSDGALKDNYNYNIGVASSIVVTRVIYRWPMFSAILQLATGDTGSNERFLYSAAVFRNEPFPF